MADSVDDNMSFTLVCGTTPAFTSQSRDDEDALRAWTMLATLKSNAQFELEYDAQDLIVRLSTAETIRYELSNNAKQLSDSPQLMTFVPIGNQQALSNLLVRLPTNKINDWTQAFVVVDHGRFESDPFGGRGYYRARYMCADAAQLSVFDETNAPPCQRVRQHMYNCSM